MRLRNKKTGEIGELHYEPDKEYHFTVATEDPADIMIFKTLAELNAEWEDAPKEPKEYWFIDYDGGIIPFDRRKETATDRLMKSIGNYFETKEEAEKALEKLNALTKLCKKGFEFNSVEMFGSGFIKIEASIPISEKTTLQERSDITDGLYLLFGGEDE